MGYWLRGHEGERNNCFGKIQPAGQKHQDKTTLISKRDSATIVLVFKAGPFRYWWAITYSLVVAQPITERSIDNRPVSWILLINNIHLQTSV